MNEAIEKFNKMFETFDSTKINELEYGRAKVIIQYGQNLINMYPELNGEIDSSEIIGRMNSLKMMLTEYDISFK